MLKSHNMVTGQGFRVWPAQYNYNVAGRPGSALRYSHSVLILASSEVPGTAAQANYSLVN